DPLFWKSAAQPASCSDRASPGPAPLLNNALWVAGKRNPLFSCGIIPCWLRIPTAIFKAVATCGENQGCTLGSSSVNCAFASCGFKATRVLSEQLGPLGGWKVGGPLGSLTSGGGSVSHGSCHGGRSPGPSGHM